MALNHHVFQAGEGPVQINVEETIAAVGRMGQRGMHTTNMEIINIMFGIEEVQRSEDKDAADCCALKEIILRGILI